MVCRLRIVLLLFSCLGSWFRAPAQLLQKPLRVLTTKDGLPQSFISGLVQDKDGFMWIGTRNGMVRYDGRRFKIFRHLTRDSSTLASNLIISMKADKRNQIWVEHESSNLDCIDPLTETVDHVTARPLFRSKPVNIMRRGWLSDSGGNLWCIPDTGSLYKYDWKNKRITNFNTADGLPGDSIRGLFEDSAKNLWIINNRGIALYNASAANFTQASFPFGADFGPGKNINARIVAVLQRRNGEIMLADRLRLIFYNPAKKSFRTVPFRVPLKTGVCWLVTGPDGSEYMESEGIVYRYSESEGVAAIATIGFTATPGATSFTVDRSGLIWLGTNAAGIHQVDITAPFFESHPTHFSFHQDVLMQEFGISLSEITGWQQSDKSFYNSSYFFRFTYDSQGRLWIAMNNHVCCYDPVQKKITMMPVVPIISNLPEYFNGIRGISFSPQGECWIISDLGDVYYLDKAKNKWVVYLDKSILQQVNPEISLTSLLAEDDKLWITSASQEGLICIDIPTKNVRRFNREKNPELLPTNILLGMQEDPTRPDLLWIGSYEGLVCMNKKTMKSEFFSLDEGLPDNTIYSIQTDRNGYLWISTNKGLCRFHPVTHQVRIFQTADGLPGDEFNRFHHLKLPDGRLAFGGTEGWVLFDPTRIKPDSYQPPVAFTGISVNNITADHQLSKQLLPAPLNSLGSLTLPYDQNTVSLEFAGMEFNQPFKLKYRYQLKGFNDDWVHTDNPVATYTKLPPGHYSLLINSTNTSGEWSSNIRTLDIIIAPPFWRSWLAYLIYALLVAGFIWLYVQYRINRERMQHELVLKEKESSQLKAVDEMKTHFFSNITHEFRTPLTLILTPAQQLKENLQKPDHQKKISAIERNAYHLLKLINQLLELSKIESGSVKEVAAPGDLGATMIELVSSFKEEAESKQIRLTLTNNLTPGNYWFDADKLEHMIMNLIANALKFTPDGGVIEVFVDENKSGTTAGRLVSSDKNTGDGVSFSVRDTGTGIPAEQLPYIFNRFYQANSSGSAAHLQKSGGSGIGLALVKELVDLQKGSITVKSPGVEPWKTVFEIWLPYRKASADEEAAPRAAGLSEWVNTRRFDSRAVYETKPATENDPVVLVTEDNPELVEFISTSLGAPYNIHKAANGAEGLAKAFELIPDLVISDVLMPVMDGFEFCRRLKEDERTSHVPLIMLTAKAALDDRIEGLTSGADGYLTKPFNVQELQLKVGNILQRQSRLREQMRELLSLPSPPPEEAEVGLSDEHLQDPFIKKLYAIIDENLDSISFGVEELSRDTGMSRTNLHRKLKTIAGVSPGDVIRNYRLKKAAVFLKEGFNSSETAYRSGFSSPAYFTKCFREFYKLTPSEFVKQNN